MDKCKERGRQFVVTGGDAPEVFETLEKAFDLLAVFVESLVVFLRIDLVFARRNASKSLPILNISKNFGSVVPPCQPKLECLF